MNGEQYEYKWLVLLSSSVANAFAYGLLFSVGIWYKEWIHYFHGHASSVSIACALPASVASLSGIFFGILIEKFGVRRCGFTGGALIILGMAASYNATTVLQLCITFGVIMGFGIGLNNFASCSIINDYFVEKRMLAEGVFGGGLYAGSFILSILQQYLANIYTWRGAILITGAICFNTSLCSMFYIPSKNIATNPLNLWKSSDNKSDNKEESRKTDEDNNYVVESARTMEPQFDSYIADSETEYAPLPEKRGLFGRTLLLFRNPVFYLILMVHFFHCLGTLIPYVHLVEKAEKDGIDVNTAAWLLSVIGLAGIIGRPLTGIICSCLGLHPMWSYFMAQIATSLCIFTMSFISDLHGLFACAITLGLVSNGYGFIKASAGFMLGPERFADAYSWMLVVEGIGVLAGPTLAGFLYDSTKSYNWSFRFSGALTLIAALLCLFKPSAEKLNRKYMSREKKKMSIYKDANDNSL